MRVGVYVGAFNPLSGGGYTLQNTILDEMKRLGLSKYEFIFFYNGGLKTPKSTIVDGLLFYNISRQSNFSRKIMKYILTLLQSKTASKYYVYDNLCKKFDIDIFWFVTPSKGDITYPYIFTVWDLGHKTFPWLPETCKEGRWSSREYLYSTMIPKATYVITGNETGRKEITDNYHISIDRIIINPFPISSFCYCGEKKPCFDVPDHFFFYPAQFWAHKNHVCVVEAVKTLKEKYEVNVKVIFSGSDQGNKEYIESRVKKYGLSDSIIFSGFIQSEEIKYLYRHAIALVFASLLGPNNLPPIEAQFLSCPVIISDIEGHREQMGDSVMYFNGFHPDELAECMYKVLTDQKLREGLIEKGIENSKKYASFNYCDRILEVLEDFDTIRNLWKS